MCDSNHSMESSRRSVLPCEPVPGHQYKLTCPATFFERHMHSDSTNLQSFRVEALSFRSWRQYTQQPGTPCSICSTATATYQFPQYRLSLTFLYPVTRISDISHFKATSVRHILRKKTVSVQTKHEAPFVQGCNSSSATQFR